MRHDPLVYDIAERIVSKQDWPPDFDTDEYVKEVHRVADLLDPPAGAPTTKGLYDLPR